MKTTHQILNMSPRQLRRLVARQQVEIASHEHEWSGGGDPDDIPQAVTALSNASRIKREVYAATRQDTSKHRETHSADLPKGWGTFARVDVATGRELDLIGMGDKDREKGETDADYRARLKAPDLCGVCHKPMVAGDQTYAGTAHWGCAMPRSKP